MKKKILLILTLIIFLIVGSIIIYEKNSSISIIENIKNRINKQSQITENENITTVDVTNLETGSNINHQHIFKTNYDSTQHWNECIICHEKTKITNHSITTTWTLGYESCGKNQYTKTCVCGYKETGYKPCVWDGRSYISHTGFAHFENGIGIQDEFAKTHARKCSICGLHIFHKYYMYEYGNGEVYNLTTGKGGTYAEYCINSSNGMRLSCNNPGTCSKCGGRTRYSWLGLYRYRKRKIWLFWM